jgi:hypothetical protein
MALRREINLAGLQETPRWIVLCVGAYLAVDLFVLHVCSADARAFSIQGNPDSSSALSVAAMAAVSWYLSILVLRGFRAGEPLRRVWMPIAWAAGAQAVSGALAQVLGADWMLNPLLPPGHAQSGPIGQVRMVAQIAAGPFRMALLAAALLVVLRFLRKFGFWVRPSAADRAVCGIVCLFTLCRFAEAGRTSVAGGLVDWTSLAALPFLCVLVLEAMLVRQSLLRMGSGPISKCWAAFMCGVFLTALAELALWMVPHFSPAWPPAVIGSLARFPTAAVFALAPAYQLMAQRLGTAPAGGLPQDSATLTRSSAVPGLIVP